ncbi:MAG: DUF4317 family protein [Bacillota bacterium]|nr:DUF4317 family protein [Bacillota bacterium]
MNKQDIASIRKELKVDNTMLQIKEVYSVYFKMDNQSEIFSEFNFFESFDSEKQELYIKNYKKLLTGTVDTKLFELNFAKALEENADENEENTQKILYRALQSSEREDFTAYCSEVIKKIGSSIKYDTDVVINFIRADYYKGAKNRSADANDNEDDIVSAFKFIMCSINKIEPPKKNLRFDYNEREFKASSSLDIIVNLNAPLDGFMFPCFNNEYSDVNKVMYYSSKSGIVNHEFIENVLNCDIPKSAKEEKEEFNVILKNVIGDKITTEVMHNIYEKLEEKLEDEDESELKVINKEDIKEILMENGIDNNERLELAIEEVTGNKNSDFKVQNIIPDMKTKSIKIDNESMSITLSPKDLKNIKQVRNSRGNKCLLIELTEDIVIDGFTIETEEEK